MTGTETPHSVSPAADPVEGQEWPNNAAAGTAGKGSPLGFPRPPAAPSWRRLLRRLWTSPDPDLVDAGQRGEWLIASIRLLLVVALLYFPLSHYVEAPLERSRQAVLWVGAAALAEALVIYVAVQRSWGRRWIGFFSGVLDVSLVSLGLWIFILLGDPLTAIDDPVIFPVYFLAIGATSLRYDWRICVLTGSAAVLQYLGIVTYGAWHWELTQMVRANGPGSGVQWLPQVARLVLLGMATLLSSTLVVRAREQRRLSTRDRLTNLANRGFFDESLGRIGALAARNGDSLTIVMIDVDHFKRFNDTYGHLAGDDALRAVARVFAGSFRATDLLARYGGEEFAGIFLGMGLTDARRRMEDLRERIASTPIAVDNRGNKVQITVSIGLAVWPMDGGSVAESLALADLRLYRAKRDGRNRLVAPPLAGESEEEAVPAAG